MVSVLALVHWPSEIHHHGCSQQQSKWADQKKSQELFPQTKAEVQLKCTTFPWEGLTSLNHHLNPVHNHEYAKVHIESGI